MTIMTTITTMTTSTTQPQRVGALVAHHPGIVITSVGPGKDTRGTRYSGAVARSTPHRTKSRTMTEHSNVTKDRSSTDSR